MHWRQPSRASWIPLLDTKLLPRLASGRRQESYFPIAVADNRFHCIILKGGDQYPYFPRPLLSEFDFSIPLGSSASKSKSKSKAKAKTNGGGGDAEDEDGLENSDDNDMDVDSDAEDNNNDESNSESRKLEQQFLLHGVHAAQTQDLIESTSSTHAQRAALARLEVEIDKTLLQLLAIECREGEERGMRALEMVQLMRDRSGRMIDAAGKVAERYGRLILGEKIREVGERRVGGIVDDL